MKWWRVCAIGFFFSPSPVPSPPPLLPLSSPSSCRLPQRDERSLMPRSGGNEISALPSLPAPFPFSISASQKTAVHLIEPREELSYCHGGWRGGEGGGGNTKKWPPKKHFVLVSQAPTPLCGPGASAKFKELPPTANRFAGRLYGS